MTEASIKRIFDNKTKLYPSSFGVSYTYKDKNGLLRLSDVVREGLDVVIHTPNLIMDNPYDKNSSRNFWNAQASDIMVVTPGGMGTVSEMLFAIENNKQVIVFLNKKEIDKDNLGPDISAKFIDESFDIYPGNITTDVTRIKGEHKFDYTNNHGESKVEYLLEKEPSNCKDVEYCWSPTFKDWIDKQSDDLKTKIELNVTITTDLEEVKRIIQEKRN